MIFSTPTLIISVIAFLAVVGMIEGFYMLYRGMNVERTSKVNKRLRALSASGLSHEQTISLLRQRNFSEIPWLNRLLMSLPRLHNLDRMLMQSGVDLTVFRYLMIQFGTIVGLFVLLFLILGVMWFFALPIALLGGLFLPYLYVHGKKRERADKISQQLPEALDFLARSLRAGNPFSAALKLASQELADPLASEFGLTFDQMNFGIDLDEALHHLADRTSSEEMRYFITAILIQRSTGGNLAEVLNRLSSVMRARARTFREIKVLAAEMKLSANMLIALPFIVAGALTVLNPDYLLILIETTMGYFIIGAQLMFMVTGYIVIHRMINFRV